MWIFQEQRLLGVRDIVSFEFSSQGVRMDRHRSPEFPTFASWGMWLLGSVLGSALSLAAQQPVIASAQSSPDSSSPSQKATPGSNEGPTAAFIAM